MNSTEYAELTIRELRSQVAELETAIKDAEVAKRKARERLDVLIARRDSIISDVTVALRMGVHFVGDDVAVIG